MKRRTMIAVALVLAAGACADSGSTNSMLSLALHKVAGSTPDVQTKDPFDGANFLRFTVAGSDFQQAVATFDITLHHGGVPPFPYGFNRQITVEGCATQECLPQDVLSRGRTVPTTFRSGDQTRNLSVFLAPRNSMAVTASANATDSDPDATSPTLPVHADRLGATVTLLDDGRILIAGGARTGTGGKSLTDPAGLKDVLDSAEVFDPKDGSYTEVGPMSMPRVHHQAVKLASKANGGKVVLIGGYTQSNGGALTPTPSVEIFDPEGGDQGTGAFTAVDSANWMPAGRARFTAGLAYPDQDVMFLAGGDCDHPAAGGTWDLYTTDYSVVGHGELNNSAIRWNHQMNLVTGWRKTDTDPGTAAFLISGGEDANGTVSYFEAYKVPVTADGQPARTPPPDNYLYVDPDPDAMTDLPGGARTLHQAVYVPSRQIVYLVGGFSDAAGTQAVPRVDVYWVGPAYFNDPPRVLHTARGGHTATLLNANTIFIVGGQATGGTPLGSTERLIEKRVCDDAGNCHIEPTIEPNDTTPNPTPDLPKDDASGDTGRRFGHAAVFDATQRLFLFGGLQDAGQHAVNAVYYNPD